MCAISIVNFGQYFRFDVLIVIYRARWFINGKHTGALYCFVEAFMPINKNQKVYTVNSLSKKRRGRVYYIKRRINGNIYKI